MNENELKSLILDSADEHPKDLIAHAAKLSGRSPRTIFNHVASLVREGSLSSSGRTKGRRYARASRPRPAPASPGAGIERYFAFPVSDELSESEVWERFVAPELAGLPENVRRICQHGVTEMVNNVIDHSGAKRLDLKMSRGPDRVRFFVADDGVGIFEKIRAALGLSDYKAASLELYKGKFTTDPKRHSGEGIFFTSRAFDGFRVAGNGCVWTRSERDGRELESFAHDAPKSGKGTLVLLDIAADSPRSLSDVFDEFSGQDDYSFSKTVFPLKAAETATGPLLSRSQAKRVLARLENFREIVLDFAGVAQIGQAFADEVFRVFKNAHPSTRVTRTNQSPEVEKMIRRALSRN